MKNSGTDELALSADSSVKYYTKNKQQITPLIAMLEIEDTKRV